MRRSTNLCILVSALLSADTAALQIDGPVKAATAFYDAVTAGKCKLAAILYKGYQPAHCRTDKKWEITKTELLANEDGKAHVLLLATELASDAAPAAVSILVTLAFDNDDWIITRTRSAAVALSLTTTNISAPPEPNPVPPTPANVVAKINLAEQRMTVVVNGQASHDWPVSTARRGYRTPRGTFVPTLLSRYHRSRKYHNAPMPHSIFFRGGYAVHGTTSIRSLGRPASHGCIRLHPKNAARLFSLVKQYGKQNTQIVVF